MRQSKDWLIRSVDNVLMRDRVKILVDSECWDNVLMRQSKDWLIRSVG